MRPRAAWKEARLSAHGSFNCRQSTGASVLRSIPPASASAPQGSEPLQATTSVFARKQPPHGRPARSWRGTHGTSARTHRIRRCCLRHRSRPLKNDFLPFRTRARQARSALFRERHVVVDNGQRSSAPSPFFSSRRDLALRAVLRQQNVPRSGPCKTIPQQRHSRVNAGVRDLIRSGSDEARLLRPAWCHRRSRRGFLSHRCTGSTAARRSGAAALLCER